MRTLRRKPALSTQTFIVQTKDSTKLISAHDTEHAIAISQEIAPDAKVQPLPRQTVFQFPFEVAPPPHIDTDGLLTGGGHDAKRLILRANGGASAKAIELMNLQGDTNRHA